MEHEQVLRALLERIGHEPIRFAVTGAFGMGILGIPRNTADLDFLVHRDDLPRWDAIVEALGYERSFRSENASHWSHHETVWGWIDALHAFRPITVGMLGRARRLEIAPSGLLIPVVSPEDLIGLKVQAFVNDPDRSLQDQADIEAIARKFGSSLDWKRVREYHSLFRKETLFDALFERYGKPHP